jgi:hypothetical protein
MSKKWRRKRREDQSGVNIAKTNVRHRGVNEQHRKAATVKMIGVGENRQQKINQPGAPLRALRSGAAAARASKKRRNGMAAMAKAIVNVTAAASNAAESNRDRNMKRGE